MRLCQSENRGEICVRGRCNFKGYLKRPTVTAETIDADGWIHTGDVGEWMPNGALRVIDRKKNIFKLMQGEYVAPEKVEQVYNLSPWVDQVFVDGKSAESYAVGVAVLNKEYTEAWARNNGVAGTFEELLQTKDVKKALLEHLQNLGKDKGLNGFEQVKRVLPLAEPFSVENGLLTPTLKLKRVSLRKFFKDSIETLYCA
jgi:long-chain acyl-CoA synthetase